MNSGSPAECNQLAAAASWRTRRLNQPATDSHGVSSSTARVNPRSPLNPRLARASVRSVCRVFHPLDGFLLLRPTQPCFMPGALMRFALRGVSLRRAALLSEPLLPCRLGRRTRPPKRNRTKRPATSKLCSRRRSVPTVRVSTTWQAVTPLGLCPSEAFSPATEARKPKHPVSQPLHC
jgi:hypothetical protein